MKTLIILFFFLTSLNLYSQSPGWHTLPNAPFGIGGRFEDTYFINPSTGWVIDYVGKVYRTTTGGSTWDTINSHVNNALRSTGFFDSNTGIIGTLDSVHVLFRTTNGGENWSEVTSSILGTTPKGLCGISIVNSTTAFGCGRYSCPSYVIKTTNSGLNWISLPIDTSLARSLIDCYFWSADSGFVVGGYSPSNNYMLSKSVILMTTNGGTNWIKVYGSTRINEWCWKIQFVNRQLGYSSIERFAGTTFYLKTTNGGLNWIENSFINNYDVEGIGFINENTGWIGGHTGPTYETTNGGLNWHLSGWGTNLNRIRFLSDTLAYAVGQTVYKFTTEPIGIQPISTEIPKQFLLHQNFPNPFNPATDIKFQIANSGFISLVVYDILGREITTLVNEHLKAGLYSVSWDASNYPSGVYFYTLLTNNFYESKKMILLK